MRVKGKGKKFHQIYRRIAIKRYINVDIVAYLTRKNSQLKGSYVFEKKNYLF